LINAVGCLAHLGATMRTLLNAFGLIVLALMVVIMFGAFCCPGVWIWAMVAEILLVVTTIQC